MEPEPARCPVASPACWICLDSEPDESGARPQPTGCACRGGATTHAHVGCLAKFAQEKEETWRKCPTCEQNWTGPVHLALSRRRHELAAGLPKAHPDRVHAAGHLTRVLRQAGEQLEGARAVVAAQRFCRCLRHSPAEIICVYYLSA